MSLKYCRELSVHAFSYLYDNLIEKTSTNNKE